MAEKKKKAHEHKPAQARKEEPAHESASAPVAHESTRLLTSEHVSKGTVDDGKTIAIISYLTWVGLIIAFVMNSEKKNSFARYHIRQSLLLMLISLVGVFVFWIPFIGWIISIGLFVLWLLGIISAINGEEKEVPVIGKYAQDIFKGI